MNSAALLALVLVVSGLIAPSLGYGTPTLLYSGKGLCEGNYCERGWYSSPAVVTNPTNDQRLIVGAAYSVAAIDGATGDTVWKRDSSPDGGRVWPGIVVADFDQNDELEVAVASAGGWVALFKLDNGTDWSSAWPYRPNGISNEWRALTVADFNQDGDLELAVGRAAGNNLNTFVLDHRGGNAPGWPRPQSTADGYTWGVYNNNFGVADMDGDGEYELISPSDVHYVCAYRADGTPYPINKSVFTDSDQTYWGHVGFYINETFEQQGYGPCGGPSSTIRTNFADGPVSIADLDNDGSLEYVLVGRTYRCTSPETTTFNGVHIVKGDRTRYTNSGLGYDWHVLPIQATHPDMGDPISLGAYNVIEDATYNPVLADLDNDDIKEILYSSYDGKVHAWWLDKTEKHSWPFDLQSLSSGMVFASEPVVADLDGDGFAEVIFATWTEKDSDDMGRLVILDYQGRLNTSTSLPNPSRCIPEPSNCPRWNGALGAPTLANVNSDANLEVVLVTANSGIVVYTIPDTNNPTVLWGTGRGNIQRTGSTSIPSVGSGSGGDGADGADGGNAAQLSSFLLSAVASLW